MCMEGTPSVMQGWHGSLRDLHGWVWTHWNQLLLSQGSGAACGEGETQLPLWPAESAQTPAGAQGEGGCVPQLLCSWRCPWGCSQPAAEHQGWLELGPGALPASFQRAFQAGSTTFQTQMCSHCSSALPGEREKTGTSQFQQQDDDMSWCANHSSAAQPLWMNSIQNHKVYIYNEYIMYI